MSFQRLSETERAKLQQLRDRKEALMTVIRALERYSKGRPRSGSVIHQLARPR